MMTNESPMDSFLDFPENSSLWVYHSSKPLNEPQLERLQTSLTHFVKNWKSHGQALKADFSLYLNQFVILVVHPSSMASGCSIDGSVHLLKSLETELETEFLNNALVPIRLEDNRIVSIPFLEARKDVKTGKIARDAKVFNLSVRNLSEFRNNFQIDLMDSFLKNSLPA